MRRLFLTRVKVMNGAGGGGGLGLRFESSVPPQPPLSAVGGPSFSGPEDSSFRTDWSWGSASEGRGRLRGSGRRRPLTKLMATILPGGY